ncbi:MAG: cation:proton antiporter [Chitinophagales bacterium]|nr:cation:proton antiporter [Chitinophagales bacterium]
MRRYKNTIFYISVTSFALALMYWIILLGAKLEQGRNIIPVNQEKSQWLEFVDSLVENLQHPVALLLAQIVSIIFVARIFGWICRKIGQPTVVGEMIAGIVLGPSLVGLYFPDLFNTLFPENSLGNLEFLSLIGLILYMFVVGMELDFNVLKSKAQEAIIISHASIIIPFTLGVGLTYFIYDSFAPEGVQFFPFALFIGITMSITAFPVLARIVQERNMHKTRLGTIVMTAAAADDITAWSLLAVVIAIAKAGSPVSALYTVALAVIYVFIMLKVVRPFLGRIGNLYKTKKSMTKSIVGIFFLTLIISSYITEVIGIHALFGAFMAGAIMPNNMKFREIFVEKVEDVAMLILLPLFFVYTGLRTEIGLLNDVDLWKVTGIIIVVAVTGKFVGSFIAAKFVGQSWKNSLIIGTLMNTRGLVELVVLNIGYDLGVLSPEIFAMLVIMALATTFMTGPILNMINWIFKSKEKEIPNELNAKSKFKILMTFGNPENGKTLLRLAHHFIKKNQNNAQLTAMHLSHGEHHSFDTHEYEEENFSPIIEEAEELEQKLTTLFKVSSNIDSDIIEIANKGDYDLLLIGIRQSIFEGSLLGKVLGFTTKFFNPENLLNQITGKENLFEDSPFDVRTKSIINRTKIPVGVFINKGFENSDNILIPIFSKRDIFLIEYAKRLINNNASQIVVWDIQGSIKNEFEIKEHIRMIEMKMPNHISILNDKLVEKELLKRQNLMIISSDSWRNLIETKSLWLSDIPSTLIIKE